MRRRDEVLVGIFTTVAIVVLMLSSVWLVRGGLSQGYLLYSRYSWGSGIKQGAPVWLVGVTVGNVDRVELDPGGTLLVTYRIQSQYKVPLGTTAAIVPNGFFGDQAVALTPAAPNLESFAPGDTIPLGKAGTGLQGLVQRADTLTQAVTGLLVSLKAQMVDSGGLVQIRKTTATLNRLLQTMNEVAEVQSRELQSTMVAARSRIQALDSATIDSTLRSMQASAASMEEFTRELTTSSARFNTILAKFDSGDGTLPRLLQDPALYEDLRKVIGHVDSLLLQFMANPRRFLKFSVF